MSTTIDSGGRVVIPKTVRDALGLAPGARVEVVARDGLVVIVPQSAPMRLVERDGLLVAVADGELPTLTVDTVRDVLEASRR